MLLRTQRSARPGSAGLPTRVSRARTAPVQAPPDDDQRLRREVVTRLSQTSLRWLDIQIHVDAGLVRLCGSLRDPRLRTHAEWLVFTTPGVQAVCSDWQTRRQDAASTRSH